MQLHPGIRPILAVLVLVGASCADEVAAPVARVAGPSASVPVGLVVSLDGSRSEDSGEKSLEFAWRFVSLPAGSHARLQGEGRPQAFFRPDVAGEYGVALAVSNGVLSSESRLAVTAACNVAVPVVVVTAPAVVTGVGVPVSLSSTVSDPDAEPSCGVPGAPSLSWRFLAVPAGSRARLSGVDGPAPWFVPDLEGRYEVEASATDATARTGRGVAVVEVSACGARPPVIDELAVGAASQGRPVSLGVTFHDPDVEGGCASADSLEVAWRVVRRPPGSVAQVQLASSPSPSFVPDVAGAWRLEVVVRDASGLVAIASRDLDVDGCGSGAPVIVSSAASPASAGVGQLVSLSAVVEDPDSACGVVPPARFSWRVAALPPGSGARLNDVSSERPWFVADREGEYRFELVVTDATGRAGAPSGVVVPVSSCGGAAPVAVVTLPGTATAGRRLSPALEATDADGAEPCGIVQELRARWWFASLPAGSHATLEHAETRTPSFLPDVPGTYSVAAIVTDSTGRTSARATAQVVVSACGVRDPVVSPLALPDSGRPGLPVVLRARVNDPDDAEGCGSGEPTFAWSFDAVPAGSASVLDGASRAEASFVPDLAGTYVVRVVVTDATGRSSAPTDLSYVVGDCGTRPPAVVASASAGAVLTGRAVTLNAAAVDADDADGCGAGPSSLAWSFETLPAGSLARLDSASSSSASFVADLPGRYVVAVVATDGTGRKGAPSLAEVTASACGLASPVVALAPSPSSPRVGSLVAVRAVATDADASTECGQSADVLWRWSFEARPAGSRVVLPNPGLQDISFIPDVPGSYVLRAEATDAAGLRGAATVTVVVGLCGSNAPTVSIAGPVSGVAIGAPLVLVATPSDADDSAACRALADPPPASVFSYAWRWVQTPAGSLVRFDDATAASPRLLPDRAGRHVAAVVLSDGTGRASAITEFGFDVTACGSNPPTNVVASATPASVSTGQPSVLDVTFTDADLQEPCTAQLASPDTHRVSWRVLSAPAGSVPTLDGANRARASLVAGVPGAYVLEARVTDSSGRQGAGTTTVTVSACGTAAPVAAPTVVTTAPYFLGNVVRLRANATDADESSTCGRASAHTYTWELASAPAGSTAFFASAGLAEPSIVPDRAGSYVAVVRVVDASGRVSAPASVSFTADPCGETAPAARVRVSAPTNAVAGPATSLVVNPLLSCEVQFDGRASSDADAACGRAETPELLSYSWTQELAPAGSTSRLSNGTAANPWFRPDLGGRYSFRLDVGDGVRWSDPARLEIVHAGFEVASVAPAVACVGAVPANFVLTAGGQGFLRITATSAAPVVTFAGTARPVTALENCGPSGVAGIEACTTLRFSITNAASLGQGDYRIRVTNPVASGCSGEVIFSVGPTPTVTSVTPTQLCAREDPLKPDQFNLNVNGTGFVGATQVTLTGGRTALDTTLVSATRIVAQFDIPPPGTYAVTASNGPACGNTLASAFTVLSLPIVFFVDPPVLYSGISTQATMYVSGLNGSAVTAVAIRPRGSGVNFTSVDFTYDPTKSGQVQVVIPQGLAAGEWEAIVTDALTCTSIPLGVFTVTNTLNVPIARIDPPFGWTNDDTAVDLLLTTPLPGGAAGFDGAPRVYLNPTGGGLAQGLSAVSVASSTVANAVVRRGLAVGTYDVIVVNGNGTVGVKTAGFEVTSARPPVIDTITPGSIPRGATRRVTVRGNGFNAAATARLDCLEPGNVSRSYASTVVTSTPTQLAVDVPGAILVEGAVCVVVVTNPGGIYGEFSALGVTGPSENLPSFTAAGSMVTARRAPAVAAGRPTRTVRFIYAAGGDSGVASGALSSVEAAQLDRYGVLGAFRTLPVPLPAPRTLGRLAQVGRFLYAVGGHNGTAATSSVVRAEVLDPGNAPDIDDLLLTINASALQPGTWFYRVSAVLTAGDAANPGGETLASDPLPVRVPTGFRLQASLRWTAVPNAAKYRVYRSPNANDPANAVTLLAEVTAPTVTYLDTGTATSSGVPRRLGDTGAWAAMPSLATARSALGLSAARDPSDAAKWYLYAVAGHDGAAPLTSYEFLPITVATDGAHTVAASWSAGLLPSSTSANLLSRARAELSTFTVDEVVASVVGANRTYVFAGPGRGPSTLVSDVDGAEVLAGGRLSAWSSTRQLTNRAGYGAMAAANQLYAFGGAGGAADTSARSTGFSTPMPDLSGWNAGSASLATARLFMGTTVENAHIYVIGGASDAGVALSSVESLVW